MEYPIIRPKRGSYDGPRPQPGQTAMLCPTERRYRVFDFQPDDSLRCQSCGFPVTRNVATDNNAGT